MDKEKKLLQKHNQILIDHYQKYGPVTFGPYSSFTWRHDPKHVFFTLSRYKFCAKLLQGRNSVIEIGCGDSFGSALLLQSVSHLHGVDIEPLIIEDNLRRNEYGERLTFQAVDITAQKPDGCFDAAISLDVVEHIPNQLEHRFMENISGVLVDNAVCIIGTPNITAQEYASENSRQGHINLKDQEGLKCLMETFFKNVFIFSMNDEIVHTGFYPMSHYLLRVGFGLK